MDVRLLQQKLDLRFYALMGSSMTPAIVGYALHAPDTPSHAAMPIWASIFAYASVGLVALGHILFMRKRKAAPQGSPKERLLYHIGLYWLKVFFIAGALALNGVVYFWLNSPEAATGVVASLFFFSMERPQLGRFAKQLKLTDEERKSLYEEEKKPEEEE